jgi:hypothetical protein
MESYGNISLPVIFGEVDSFPLEHVLLNIIDFDLTCNAIIGTPTLQPIEFIDADINYLFYVSRIMVWKLQYLKSLGFSLASSEEQSQRVAMSFRAFMLSFVKSVKSRHMLMLFFVTLRSCCIKSMLWGGGSINAFS